MVFTGAWQQGVSALAPAGHCMLLLPLAAGSAPLRGGGQGENTGSLAEYVRQKYIAVTLETCVQGPSERLSWSR